MSTGSFEIKFLPALVFIPGPTETVGEEWNKAVQLVHEQGLDVLGDEPVIETSDEPYTEVWLLMPRQAGDDQ